MLAGEALGDIEARFLAAYVKAGRPPGMALFSRHESEGRLHCEVALYFSPAAAAVAQQFDAHPCARPSPQGLGLLAGDDACWPALFPEHND